jgi:glycosyltransferase involved in cell wall biosynthesis
MRKINVLQLVEGFSFGGAEGKLLELVERLDKSKYNVTVCSLGLGGILQEKFEKIGVKVFVISRKSKFDCAFIFKLVKLMREEKIDILQTTLFFADFIGPIAAKLAGVRVTLAWETISAPEWLVKRRLIAYKIAMKFADKIISVSEATKTWSIKKRGISPEKLVTIPYGVDLQKYNLNPASEKRKELGVSSGTILFGTVARLHKQKGHVYLIKAVKDVVKEIPNVKFVFIGDGELREELEEQVNKLKIADNFLFLGFRYDVNELLKTLDVFILPSLYEGLPNVILEAMACGRPVIATSVDGSPEAIENNVTGILVPPRDPVFLKQAISQLAKNKKLRESMGKEGRYRVEKYFSLRGQLEKFENMYDKFFLKKVVRTYN